MQTVKSSVARGIITRLTQIQEEIGDLVEELEILSDEELMRDIEESEKDFEEGRYYTFEEIMDLHKKLGKNE
ncbi:MAG: hypothetical protein ACXQS6_02420 [Candidatus Syntropharchaeales archaeon]|uniref:Uncharacterized protein n=1 Tax=Candidatus Syntropharchaeum caldarium TaxID=1838285 RepID=A0A1F2PAT0_9EURY|nr:MAG: hypothetical protein SCAL_000093 [Candidatus Syntrophoarchaeum caldarius]